MGMMSGAEVGRSIFAILRQGQDPARLRRRYIRFVEQSSAMFFRLVDMYYDHSFRALFLTGQGPLEVHRAAMSILAGYVFPRPSFALYWRFQLLRFFTWFNRYVPLAPRRERFSLLAQPAPAGAAGETAPLAGAG